jgi:hypothetical protein
VHNTLARQCGALPLFGNTFAAQKTYAAWPVWSGSVTEARFHPTLTRRQARELVDKAERWDIQTRQPGHHGGVIGTIGVRVLRVLTQKFLHYKTGRCDPCQKTLARAVGACERSVASALKRLKEHGLLNWLRRCEEAAAPDGGFLMRQISNAYAILPCSQWKDYEPPQPPPDPACWGARPPEDPYADAKAAKDDWARLAALEAEAACGSGVARAHANFLRRQLTYSSAMSAAASPAMKPMDTFIQDMYRRR